jgi:hypothetical protein
MTRPPMEGADWAADVIWFDALTINPDRTPRNANMVIGEGRTWLIDHGSALYVHHAWTDPEAHARRPFDRIGEHLLLPFASSIAEADARLAPRLDGATMDRIVNAVPTEWLNDGRFDGPDDERDAYRRYLADRLAARPAWVEGAERMRSEVQRDAVA